MTDDKFDAIALAVGRAILLVIAAHWWLLALGLLWLVIHARVEGWLP